MPRKFYLEDHPMYDEMRHFQWQMMILYWIGINRESSSRAGAPSRLFPSPSAPQPEEGTLLYGVPDLMYQGILHYFHSLNRGCQTSCTRVQHYCTSIVSTGHQTLCTRVQHYCTSIVSTGHHTLCTRKQHYSLSL
jgi:hypothetical protein